MKTTTSELSCYCIERTIGRGTFGKVKKAIHIHTQEPVAIKILQKNKIKDITDVERVTRELHILKLVRHSSIAQLYQVIETPDNIFMVMEYAQDGEFFDYVMDGKIKNQREAHHYFAQIVSGLEYLHQLGIAHRDVKPENMLLDVHQRLKIVDFGLSNMYKPKEQLLTACGSPCYASPEMIRGQPYDPQLTDVWSLGIVLFTMVMAKLPFQDDNTSILYSKIKSGLYLIDRKVSAQFKDLLSRLINVKAEQRLRLKDIRTHAWFTKFGKINSFGLNVGFSKIPIDQKIVKVMQGLGFSSTKTKRYLQCNIKNQCTTAYYLFLKKQFKLGQNNPADICSDTFNEELSHPAFRKRKHKSIDFNALVEKIQSKDVTDTGALHKDRKCLSQIKHMHIEVHDLARVSADAREWDRLSTNKTQYKKINLCNASVKSRDSRDRQRDAQSQLQKKSTKKKYRIDENDYKSVINRLVRENRRLQTEHVRQIYSRDMRESVKKERWMDVPDLFWKKRQTLNKGQKRYADRSQHSSSKNAIKFNNYS